MKVNLKTLAQDHDLVSIGVTFFASTSQYSAHVQWMDMHGERQCVFCERHVPDPDEAVRSAAAAKIASDEECTNDAEAAKSARIEALKRELARLTDGEEA